MKEKLSPAVEVEVKRRLALTNWVEKYPHPHEAERMTEFRKAEQQITAEVVAKIATEQARLKADQERAAQAEQARYGNPGGRYGS